MESHALPPIVQSSFINARPTRIWETLTTAEGWDAWFTQGTTIDCRAGGFVRFRWEGFAGRTAVVEDGGPILEVVPGALLVFQWSPTDHPTTVRIEIRPQGGGAFVVVSETGYERTERDLGAFVNCAAGWGEAITLLKFFLEHGLTYGAVPAAS